MGVAVAPIECLQGKGTEAVSTCACKVMGRACARGSAHLRTKRSSSRRHLRAADVQSGQRSPLCCIGPSIRAREARAQTANKDASCETLRLAGPPDRHVHGGSTLACSPGPRRCRT